MRVRPGRVGAVVMRADDRYRREYHVSGGWLWYLVAACGVLCGGFVLRLATGDVPAAVTVAVAVAAAAFLAWLVAASLRSATIVEEHRVTLRGARRSRTFAWSDVQGVEVVPNPSRGRRGTPRPAVALYDATGKRFLLPHLHDRSGLDLAREVATLREVWILGRGEAWRPEPRAAARIAYARRYRVPAAEVAIAAAAIAFAPGVLACVALLAAGWFTNAGSAASTAMIIGLMAGLPVATFAVTLAVVIRRRR